VKYFRFRNWSRFQHYSHRSPGWTKLYNKILDIDNDWYRMNDIQSGQCVRLLALACRLDNAMPFDNEVIAAEINSSHPLDLDVFKKLGMIEVLKSKADCLVREESRRGASKKASKPASVNVQVLSQSQSQSQIESKTEEKEQGSFLSSTPPKQRARPAPYALVIDYLNLKTGAQYKHTTKAYRKLIKARWDDGVTIQDFYRVIDRQVKAWKGDDRMSSYLRPTTLFNGSKFYEYRDAAEGATGEDWVNKGGDESELATEA
jgi:uncharacterized phage protein (TIGR02220 family)